MAIGAGERQNNRGAVTILRVDSAVQRQWACEITVFVSVQLRLVVHELESCAPLGVSMLVVACPLPSGFMLPLLVS